MGIWLCKTFLELQLGRALRFSICRSVYGRARIDRLRSNQWGIKHADPLQRNVSPLYYRPLHMSPTFPHINRLDDLSECIV